MDAGPQQSDPRDALIAQLQARNAELEARNAQLEARVAQLEARLKELEGQLAAATRSAKRQAAPFAKGPPKSAPKPPGRKRGDDYGAHARRAAPPRIDEELDAPLPHCCPRCGGSRLKPGKIEVQFQTEIPVTAIYRQFNVQFGECCDCHQRVQGRHPLQTSDALGACASQLGPNAHALITLLNKDLGLSHGKIKGLFFKLFNIPLSRGGACQSMLRTAGKCLPQYHSILRSVPQAPWIVADETGWRVGGRSAWLHAFVLPKLTAYLIDPRRGVDASGRVIPAKFAGTLVHDGYASYHGYLEAGHQTCLAHLLRRCREMLDTARGSAVLFPRRVKAMLLESLEVRDRREAGEILVSTAARQADELQERMRTLCEHPKRNAANDRLARHLFRNQRHLFTFLRLPGLDATNWRAEQAIRPAVVNRKVWGGNRTEIGAAAQSILMSVLRSGIQQGREMMGWLRDLLRGAMPAELAPSGG